MRVRHPHYPGNSFYRQYEKFCRPYGAHQEVRPPEERFRLAPCKVIFEHRLRELAKRLGRPSC